MSLSFSFSLPLVVGIALLWGLVVCPTDVQAVSSKQSYRNYKRLRRQIQKKYRKARRIRYSKPCRSQKLFKEYILWLGRQRDAIPSMELRSYHKRYAKRRVRQYRRYAKSQIRYTDRRCRRYWKKELTRINVRLNKRCSGLYTPSMDESAAALWIGVSPWAHVYLNGKLCGTAPLYARLRPGQYRLRLSYPNGQDEYRETLSLRAGKKPTLVVRIMKQAPPPSRKFRKLLAPKQLSWVLKRNKKQFRSCSIYSPDTKTMKLSWVITPKGKTSAIRWDSPTPVNARFKRCIIRTLSRITFPERPGSARIQAYSINLD